MSALNGSLRQAPALPEPHIQRLSDDILSQIFMLLPQGSRARSVASTCRRWRQITQRADMWKRVCLTDSIALYGRDDVKLPFLVWLQQRCSATTELQIQFKGRTSDDPNKDVTTSTVIVALAPAPALRRLLIQMPASGSISSSTLARAQLLRNLTSLQCSGLRTPVQTSALESLFTGLPALQHLALRVDRKEPHATVLPPVCWLPSALARCTGLTCLSVSVDADLGRVFNWGDFLPDVLTALRRLKTLRLRNCLTLPLSDHISALSGLTQLGLCCELRHLDGETALVPQPLPPAAAAMTGLRCLDVMVSSLPPALTSLTGLEELTIRSQSTEDEDLFLGVDDLESLSHLQRLSMLQVNNCYVEEGEALAGLDACTALRDLRIVNCCISVLPQLRCFRGLTHLCVTDNQLGNGELTPALLAMPQLRVLDVRVNYYLNLGPAPLLSLLGCCSKLQDVYLGAVPHAVNQVDNTDLGEALLEVQRSVPHIRLRLKGAPDYDFG